MFENGKYNGWSNHETWLVNLWLTNDESSYNTLVEAIELPTSTAGAEWLEEEVRWALSEQTGSACLWSDLLNLSIDRVNWLEVVESNKV